MNGVFVTGTGTEIGKTVVAAAILRAARAAGIDAAPYKPVQTGAIEGPAGRVAPDVEFSLAAADLKADADEARLMAPRLYKPACSPHLAARLEGRAVDIGEIVEAAGQLCRRREALIVEGAGGVMVPLSETQTTIDLMKALGLPVVVTATDGLGTINHTLLTLAALRAANLDVLGVVFNRPEPAGELDEVDELIRRDNPEIIARLGSTTVLGVLPYAAGLTDADGQAEAWARIESGFSGMPTVLERLKTQ